MSGRRRSARPRLSLTGLGLLPAIVTPVVKPEGEFAMTPARYPMPPIPELSVMVTDTLEAVSPAGPAVGSPMRDESILAQISLSGSVVQAVSSPALSNLIKSVFSHFINIILGKLYM